MNLKTETTSHLIADFVNVLAAAEIASESNSRSSFLDYAVLGLLVSVLVDIEENELASQTSKLLRHGSSETAARAGDEHDLTLDALGSILVGDELLDQVDHMVEEDQSERNHRVNWQQE